MATGTVPAAGGYSYCGWGFIGKTGAFRIEPQYFLLGPFTNGVAVARRKNAVMSLYQRITERLF